jgi:hypothetical protein
MLNGVVLQSNGGIPGVLEEEIVGKLVGALEVHGVLHDRDGLAVSGGVAVLRASKHHHPGTNGGGANVNVLPVDEAVGEEGLAQCSPGVGRRRIDEGVHDAVEGPPVDPRHEHLLLSRAEGFEVLDVRQHRGGGGHKADLGRGRRGRGREDGGAEAEAVSVSSTSRASSLSEGIDTGSTWDGAELGHTGWGPVSRVALVPKGQRRSRHGGRATEATIGARGEAVTRAAAAPAAHGVAQAATG